MKPQRGRPRGDANSGTICTWLPASEHDRLIEKAKREDKSVSAVVREAVRISLLDKSGSSERA